MRRGCSVSRTHPPRRRLSPPCAITNHDLPAQSADHRTYGGDSTKFALLDGAEQCEGATRLRKAAGRFGCYGDGFQASDRIRYLYCHAGGSIRSGVENDCADRISRLRNEPQLITTLIAVYRRQVLREKEPS